MNIVKNDASPALLLSADGACAALGGISRDQLARIVRSGRLPVVRLPGRRDKRGRGTSDVSRRVLYAVDDLQRLVQESKETTPVEQPTRAPLRVKGRGAA